MGGCMNLAEPDTTGRSRVSHVGGVLPRDGTRAGETLAAIVKAGVDLGALAADLQSEGARSFDESWSELLKAIETKSKALT